jgi:hypothetical protein
MEIDDVKDDGAFTWAIEKELLTKDSEALRSFYSLTGPSRKDFLIQMAEAEAQRIRIIGEAKAEAIQKVRTAEAAGYRAIAQAIAESPDKEVIVRLVGLTAAVNAAEALGNGQATKIFVPHEMGAVFSLLGSLGDVLSHK